MVSGDRYAISSESCRNVHVYPSCGTWFHFSEDNMCPSLSLFPAQVVTVTFSHPMRIKDEYMDCCCLTTRGLCCALRRYNNLLLPPHQ